MQKKGRTKYSVRDFNKIYSSLKKEYIPKDEEKIFVSDE